MLINQNMDDGLADHLPLLIFEDRDRRGVRLERMCRSSGYTDSPGHHRMGEEIRANQSFDESIFTSGQICWQVNVSGNLCAYAVELAAQLGFGTECQFRGAQ